MHKAERICWEAPQKVTEWQKVQIKKFVKSFWLILAKFGWPLLSIGLIAAYVLGPIAYEEKSDEFIKGFLLLTIFFPPVCAVGMTWPYLLRFFFKKNDRYEINEKGLFRYSYNALSVGWRRVDRCRFRNDEDFAGIRIFEFTVKPIKYIGDKSEHWNKFYFDPNEVEENQIQKIIDLNSPA